MGVFIAAVSLGSVVLIADQKITGDRVCFIVEFNRQVQIWPNQADHILRDVETKIDI